MQARVLVISGSLGSGKTVVLSEASDILIERDIAHAAIDLDWLCNVYPPPAGEKYGTQMGFTNLASVWANLERAGFLRLLLARVVETLEDRSGYAIAIPGADVQVCLLTAGVEPMRERLRLREPGRARDRHLRRAVELDQILLAAGVEDFRVHNDGRPIGDVAEEALARAGWLKLREG